MPPIPHLDPEDDQALASRVAEGDRDAFEVVFQRFGGAVRSMAMRVLRDEGLADDVVQEVFVRFWNEPGRFDQRRG
ncbi:MAG: sigma factor, partial [Acidimicrobiia bacterium]|nr:sigma factor [Acidimicrobiia bacterium]